MDNSSERALTIARQQARLGLPTWNCNISVNRLSETRELLATARDLGQPMDTREWRAAELAWVVAMQAQSCAYLATELTVFAHRLSESQIVCPESTYNQLLDSLVTFAHLLDDMLKNYRESNANGSEGLLPVLSTPLVEAIRSTLGLEQVTTSAGSTINTGSRRRKCTSGAGDMR